MAYQAGVVLVAAWLLAGCSGESQPSTTSPNGPQSVSQGSPIRVMMLTATRGFRHDSIPAARDVMSALALSSGEFTVTMTEDVSAITASTLAGYDVLFFALTTGELPFDSEQKTAIVHFVSGGKELFR